MTSVKKQLVIAIFFYLLIGYTNEFVAENQVYQNINDPPLFDRGHNLLPLLSKRLPDIGLILFILYFIIRWAIQYPTTLINYLWIISLLFIGRVVLLSVTQFPPGLPGCSTVKEGDSLYFNVFRKGWNECLDYMYSGHTIHCVLVTLFTLYLSSSMFEKIAIIMVTLLEIGLIIGSRIHYTADVLVGTLVTILIFFSWPGIDNVVKHIYSGGIYGKMLFKKVQQVEF
uniref:Sphingomyelin synthase-like domain-containing protein n=1 Tax=viral metagenome TaxID=1070528 RepID=A0A6C0II71_9ZZZZ